ncbi:MAG: 16S rRNA (uracil(1498)-N(3))-methyltransferase [Steroidobacteraceae bacterium]
MRLTRVFIDAPLEPGTRVTLEGNAAGHLRRVLRLRVGAALMVFNGRGGEYSASIDKAHGGSVTVAIGEAHAIERESPLELTLAQGISRGERMDLIVQKATELGVAHLVPLLTERSVVQLDAQHAQRKVNHWRAVAVGACEQCGRNRLPEISAPIALRDHLRTAGAADLRLMFAPDAPQRVGEVARAAGRVSVLVGPEGGLTDAEQQAAMAAGFRAVLAGPRVLRTETAAIVALTLLQHEFGDL